MTTMKTFLQAHRREFSAILLLGILAGCQSVESSFSPSVRSLSPDKGGPIPMEDLPFKIEYLDELWEGSNHNDWDVLTAVIDPVRGGQVRGVPESWPPEYVFAAKFPPHCLDSTEPFTVSLSIPRFTPGDLHSPVYLLEPHGMIFSEPVTLQFCYPPWLEGAVAYAKFNFWREGPPPEDKNGINPAVVYRVSDYGRVNAPEENLHLNLEFQTTHFSRWGMSNGNGGGDDLTFEPDNGQLEIKR